MLRDKLNEALKEAMRARDMATVGAVRLIIAKLKEVDIAARTEANRYAFYRSKLPLGNVPNAPAAAQPAAKPGEPQSQNKGELLKNLQMQNGIFNNDNRQNYRNILQNSTKGVKAKGAF